MMKMLRGSSESGQIIVVVATALFMVLLGAAAVAVDLGVGFLNKQRLQNTADAAALAAAYRVAAGGTHSDAVNAARSIVTQNTGGTVTLADRGTGSDPAFSDGIQISGTDVRVALTKSDVRTFFSGFVGRNTLSVGARSRAMVNAGGGLLPIAVKRFSAGNTLYQLGDHGNPSDVIDYIAKATTHIQNNWGPEWPGLLTGHPAPLASTTSPGPTIPILGHDAVANEAQGNDFHFWVAPDVRNITWSYPPGPTYTNGVTAGMSIQDLKNKESTYFSPTRPGYTSVEGMPRVGDQIAILNGVDTSNTVAEMAKYYPAGKQFVAMVYDGTVHRKPEFQVEVSPIFQQSGHTPRQELTYAVTLRQTNGSYPYYGTNIGLSAVGLEGSFASWSFDPPQVDMLGSDASTTLRVTAAHPDNPSPLDPEPQTTGVRSFLIKAYDSLNHIQRTATAAVVFGNDPSLVATCNSAYVQVEQGSSGRFTLDLRGYNGYPDTYVQVGGPSWEGYAPSGVSAGYVSHNPSSVPVTSQLVRDGHTASLNLYFDASSTASVGEYVMKVPLTDGSGTQYMYLSLEVVPDSAGTTVGNAVSFVYVLGFATFEVTHYDNNTAWGKVVSDLVDDPSELTGGSAVRLVGWNQ